jgi:hypothetical protein
MKVYLMHRDRDFDPQGSTATNGNDLIQDLELDILVHAMALDDKYLFDIAKAALLQSLFSVEDIRYRQGILQDCIAHPAVVREIYAIAVESIEDRRKNWYSLWSGSGPGSILYSSVHIIEMYIPRLGRLRKIADDNAAQFESDGFSRFFAMIEQELTDEYTDTIKAQLTDLEFGEGVMIGSVLGQGCESVRHSLRRPNGRGGNWLHKLFSPKAPMYSFSIHPRDESGGRALEEFRNRGINIAADALARSADHIENFFKLLKAELAFYIGCLNLRDTVIKLDEPLCFPVPFPPGSLRNSGKKIYNLCLALHTNAKAIGNDVKAAGKNPVIITGVNEGGKSTLLRSLGVAQLMMQCGMFVPAESYEADICSALFTHFRRKEDRDMKSGKFDEELTRMEIIAGQLRPYSLILFNESFAATNEREGAEIARQITRALMESEIRVIFVTHLYPFAESLLEFRCFETLFLRADRLPNGSRSFRIIEGPPSPKSHGEDLYRQVFGED